MGGKGGVRVFRAIEKTSLELMVVAGQRQDLKKKNLRSLAVVVIFCCFPRPQDDGRMFSFDSPDVW